MLTGLAPALFEEVVYGENGQDLTGTHGSAIEASAIEASCVSGPQ